MDFHVIKENDLFLLSKGDGRVPHPEEDAFGYGLFTKDTRMLSVLAMDIEPLKLTLLDADASENYRSVYHYSNEGNPVAETFPGQSILVTNQRTVDGQTFRDEVTVENFGKKAVDLTLVYHVDADFRDMFEVRGYAPKNLSRSIQKEVAGHTARLSYQAVDGQTLATDFVLTRVGDVAKEADDALNDVRAMAREGADEDQALRARTEERRGDGALSAAVERGLTLRLPIHVAAQGKETYVLVVLPQVQIPGEHLEIEEIHGIRNVSVYTESTNLDLVERAYQVWLAQTTKVSGDPSFVAWYDRGIKDIRMLLSDIGYGTFPVAGVPWYAVPFGRDSLITALQLLPVDPQVARGTLLTMAAFQGKNYDPARDEQPGKIMHELRVGEMTRIGELPFGPYYGSIDSTPLFLCLAADYFAWTGDEKTLRELLPTIDRAFAWIERDGDRDGDSFVEYYRESERGISNQGWKDSGDSVAHTDGRLAQAPIALCEVQAYVYRAYRAFAPIYRHLGRAQEAAQFGARAARLRKNFHDAFWIEEKGIVAHALDGQKKRVETAASNMGHVLFGGILDRDKAQKVAARLLSDDMFSGFGIRTLSTREVSYNPISYHNGTIWPHDNAIIIAGLAIYGFHEPLAKAAGALNRTAAKMEHHRLPELFGGLSSDLVHQPVPYPVSCSPQAWAAATPCMVLQALLGARPDALTGIIELNPVLPEGVDALSIEGMRLGEATLSVTLERNEQNQTRYRAQLEGGAWKIGTIHSERGDAEEVDVNVHGVQ